MATTQTKVAIASSTALRLFSYFFLRWILLPWFAATVFTSFAIFVPSFIWGCFNEPKKELVDEVDVFLTETSVEQDGPGNGKLAHPNGVGNKDVVAQKVDIVEAISVQNRPLNRLRTLLAGAPNPRSLLLSGSTLLINALCVGLVADRIFREHGYTGDDLSFVKLGYVSENEAKLLVREPDQSKMPVTLQIHLKDPHPPFDNPLWQEAGGVRWTTNETDYTALLTVPLRHSKPRTYEWRTSNNHSGEFTTPPSVGDAAEIGKGPFTFLSTSCIVSRLPYSPFDHPLAIPGLRHLVKVLPSLNAQFMLFLGDFIYVDVPRWWGKEVSDYRQKYRQVYASPDWQAVAQNLSWIHVLDDHEIANDWDANSTGIYASAVDPWHLYHATPNPPPAKKAGALSPRLRATYFKFTQGPASFFLLDTRSYRSSNSLPATDLEKTMLGPEQLEDFIDFLNRPEPKGVKWKIVASSVPFTKNWHFNTRDTWGGFLTERRRILKAMWDVGNRGIGVVILSGDRHEFAATKFPPPADSKWPETSAVYEFSASPLSQFYSPVPSYRQTDNEDIAIKYIHKGNSKFGAITIENLKQDSQSSLKYRLFVDGVEVWNTVVLSPPPISEGKFTGSFWDRLKLA
ncbi:PhoD-like phosphatase-domain-containing protein [Lasiosphaeria miniovina]|uniref:PhoD-like phosphatase-domain-containing protein n=1 Tax=Lasiosphaeria miniovina TaxID=1954250 RepID=A0AA40B436_9PEZI|nr:PhoD-like phosphatase-domain-containing protein [Lasiosphaeria miniovina]KAK0727334.1 PhoD-like phosphatase-domain-containing protein [Lasiosphaeria miniovina]